MRERRSVWKTAGAVVFLAVLGLGWRYPLLAYCMFLNAAAGLVSAVFRGTRWGCGNLCPRGAFYSFLPDTGRVIPRVLLRKPVSVMVMIPLLAVLIVVIRPGGSFTEWGRVFYFMIAATTLIGVAGGFTVNRYFWCAMCPMGKIYSKIGQGRGFRLHVSDACVHCGKCGKVCPFQFRPDLGRVNGVFSEPACIKCGRCVDNCPKHALTLGK